MKADRNKLIQLRQAVEETFGQTPGSPTDFDKLSLQIQTFTKRKLGVSTLKRFWGYVRSEYNATYTTLSVLARYVGFRDWDEFCSLYKVDDSNFSTTRLVIPANLKLGSIIKVEWIRINTIKWIRIKKIRHPNIFEVINATNIKLRPLDTFSIDTLIIGEKFIATDCQRGEHRLGAYIASSNTGISSLAIENPDL